MAGNITINIGVKHSSAAAAHLTSAQANQLSSTNKLNYAEFITIYYRMCI